MTGYSCGPCAVGRHQDCTGLLRANFGFCACSDRQHRSLEPEHDPRIHAKNDAILQAHIRATLHAGEQ